MSDLPRVPKTDQETSISRYRDEDLWAVDTTDPTFETQLKAKGYQPMNCPEALPYRRYKLPLYAIQIRSEKRYRQQAEAAKRLQDPSAPGESRDPEAANPTSSGSEEVDDG